nr:MAG TPA: hypothetical protein [Caudoviricetes sp.]
MGAGKGNRSQAIRIICVLFGSFFVGKIRKAARFLISQSPPKDWGRRKGD